MPEKENNQSLRNAVVAGSAWMIAMRWAIRALSVISVVILARLLTPDDFGLIAMSSLIIVFLEILTSFGADMALIQRQEAVRGHYDTAWTIRLIQTGVVTFLIIIAAPFAAIYFDEPRVTSLMIFLSLAVVISGFENIGVVAFRKEFQFDKEFLFNFIPKLIGFITTIGFVFILRSYWGMAIGSLVGALAKVVLSYMLHGYRPRFTLSHFRDLWSFSQWMLLRNVGMYLRRMVDTLAIGRFFSTSTLGVYRISQEISEMPTTEMVWPMARVLFPGYAKLSNDVDRLGQAYIKALSAISLLAVPAGVGLALVAEPLVLLMLGEKWSAAAPLVVWLALYNIGLTLSAGVQLPLMALGQMRRLAALVWIQLLLVVPAIVITSMYGAIEHVAIAQLTVTLLLQPLFFRSLTSIGLTSWRAIGGVIWRPALSSAVMAVCVIGVGPALPEDLLLNLFGRVLIGMTSFLVTEIVLWRWSGRPDGGEKLALSIIFGAVARLRKIDVR
jgi:lipopolysaccharide exporter